MRPSPSAQGPKHGSCSDALLRVALELADGFLLEEGEKISTEGTCFCRLEKHQNRLRVGQHRQCFVFGERGMFLEQSLRSVCRRSSLLMQDERDGTRKAGELQRAGAGSQPDGPGVPLSMGPLRAYKPLVQGRTTPPGMEGGARQPDCGQCQGPNPRPILITSDKSPSDHLQLLRVDKIRRSTSKRRKGFKDPNVSTAEPKLPPPLETLISSHQPRAPRGSGRETNHPI